MVEEDFSKEDLLSLTLRKDILFESADMDEVSRMEGLLIVQHRSNDPLIGYNRTHRRQSGMIRSRHI